MRRLGRGLGRLVLLLAVLGAAFWFLAPRARIATVTPGTPDLADPAGWLAAREAGFDDLTPGTEAQIQEFCSTKYDVTFPMFAKIEVNGDGRSPLYAWLTGEHTQPDGPGDIAWNFAKFVIGKDGQIVGRFHPKTAPQDLKPTIATALEG